VTELGEIPATGSLREVSAQRLYFMAAAQDANGAGFDPKWKHDVFVRGTVVPCK
jgi:hypothetical protein